MLIIFSDVLPVFVTVMFCAGLVVPTPWLGKLRLVGEKLTPGTAPVPVRFSVWGLPLPLSVMVTVPVRVPVSLGVKVTLIRHEAPTLTEAPQVLVAA